MIRRRRGTRGNHSRVPANLTAPTHTRPGYLPTGTCARVTHTRGFGCGYPRVTPVTPATRVTPYLRVYHRLRYLLRYSL